MDMNFSDEASLISWGREVGRLLQPSDVVFLKGSLGAGKTTLVKAMGWGYGLKFEEITSPTYTLHNQMETSTGRIVHHLDGYRIESAKEYDQIGLDLLPRGLTFIEWPELFDLSKPTISIAIKIKERGRRLEIEAESDHPIFKKMAQE